MKNKILVFLLVISFILSGCSQSLEYDIEQDVFLIDGVSVTVGMTNALFYAFEQQQNELYQSLLSDEFWDTICFEDPAMTYAEYEKEYIFFENLINMFILANLWEDEHELEEDEMNIIEDYADSYISSLDETTLALLEITEDDALALSTACYEALLMREEIISETTITISEEEIRVASVLFVYFETEDEANEYISALEEGQDADSLTSMAASYYQRNVSREDIEDETVREAVFALKEGMYTDVLETSDGYLVAVLKDAYLDELSEARREELLFELEQEQIEEICEAYIDEATIYVNQELWDGYELKQEELPDGVSAIYDIFSQIQDYLQQEE